MNNPTWFANLKTEFAAGWQRQDLSQLLERLPGELTGPEQELLAGLIDEMITGNQADIAGSSQMARNLIRLLGVLLRSELRQSAFAQLRAFRYHPDPEVVHFAAVVANSVQNSPANLSLKVRRDIAVSLDHYKSGMTN
jgi:hypothetical protein